ncbi:MAG: histidinol-phosphatase HisJ family protein [Clostridia bacterium]|nr:histidinol-phosphatase HisJ family protein [Clostridia bacterium]
MNNKQNLHMHSTYCDGKNTLRESAEWAFSHGFDSIGFSGHSFMYWNGRGMNPDKIEDYKSEIKQLKEEFSGRLGIYTGIEFEMFSEVDLTGYDYIIGSTHYFNINGDLIGFDSTPEWSEKLTDTYFGGDGMAFAKAYYELIPMLAERAKINILGHFDLCAKHTESVYLFDPDSKEYKNAAIEALEAIAGKIPFFEVNTGGMARGYKSTPYPDAFILKEMKRLGFGAVISSDCHDITKMDHCFDMASELLRSCGFKERYILTDSGFSAVKL